MSMKQMAAPPVKKWTYADLVAEGLDPDRYEIKDGKLEEVSDVGIEGGEVFTRVSYLLYQHVLAKDLGAVYTTARFLLHEDPRLERRPDLAFVATERLPDPPDPDLYPGAPDLAIEILSPTDPSGAACDKAREYLDTGSREAWLVDPKLETVTVLRPGRPARPYGIGDTIESEAVRGFSLPVEELFAARRPRAHGGKPKRRRGR